MHTSPIHADTSQILVTGGTGRLGPLVVERLRATGCPVRVLSRGKHPRSSVSDPAVSFATADLSTGQGVDAAVAGIDVIVHLAGSQKGDGEKARHLVAAAERAGVHHLVFISVVGADRIPMSSPIDRTMFGYFGSKREAERVIEASAVPWTTLRATQFFDIALVTAEGLCRLPVALVPAGLRFQPVDTGEVAARLAELALAAPSGYVADLAGPRIYELAELVTTYLDAADRRRRIVRMLVPGAAARAIRDGAILSPDRAAGRRTWEAFLEDRVGSPRDRSLPAGASR
ncbi:MAG TPA: NAD(P)H-binding protein [Candidatus Limnocylindrales bacterium]|jgi:uncharacterized protein YbjT (DUF2867 family)